MRRSRRPPRVPTPDLSKAIGLVRVSTSRQELSPEAQHAAIRAWCGTRHVELVDVLTEIGVSGGAELADREQLVTALRRIEAGEAGLLVVAKLDRLARDPRVAATVEHVLGKVGARLVSAAGEGTEDDTPQAIMMRRLVQMFAEYERLVIKLRTRTALRAKRKRGERVGSIPMGYALGDDGKLLVVDPAEAAMVARVRELADGTRSLRAIARVLAAEGFAPRGKAWHPQTIARIIDRLAETDP